MNLYLENANMKPLKQEIDIKHFELLIDKYT